ncbi:VPH2 (YKL119C) [Zygosaccharomyces parabailii]|nr:VPH2 (YKL119C) [Zygosaccharomyces parabailii]CDH10236.1 related to Vacuolar ATPase assembly integral membrane protein VPH2 [Zygosaccharomyces bailii ISA1307]
MFEIKLNSKLKAEVETLKSDIANESILPQLVEILDKESISIDSLMRLYHDHWQNRIPLKQLLNPLDFKCKRRPIPGANYTPEFKLKLQQLKIQQQEMDYQELIKKTGPLGKLVHDGDSISPAQMHREVKEQVTTVFNILVSVVSVSFALWYWSGSSSGMALHYRVLISLFFGILVLIAEVVVYNSYIQRVSEARTKEKCKIEKKKVIKKIVI